jgi:ribonuclease HI
METANYSSKSSISPERLDMAHKLTTYSDGGARGNPGPAAIGVVIWEGDRLLESFGRYIGETTNNQAEYRALVAALERASALGAEDVECRMDSELVVKQMRLEYKVRDKDLQPLFLKAWNLASGFKHVSFKHIPRSQNAEADAEVNSALDKHIALTFKN